MTALRAVSLLLLSTACAANRERAPEVATASAAPPPAVVAPPPEPRAPPPPPPPSAARQLNENVRRAIVAAREEGWQHERTVDVPGRAAKIVLYQPTPESAPATKAMRADAVGASGAPYTAFSGIIDVMKTRKEKSVLWDLTGEGPRFVVLHLTRCEPHCGTGQPLVLELDEHEAFRRARKAPECPTCMQDADRDGIPEFTYRMLELRIAPCSRVSCGPETALLVEVRGLESWDGETFARNLTVFRPLYEARSRAAQAEMKRVRRASRKKTVCPLDAIRVAAELFVYGRLTGMSEVEAFKASDRLMAGYSTDPCRTEYDLLATPKTWIELRSELVSAKLPTLDARRTP